MYELTATAYLDVFKIITTNVISSSSPPHYDELITKLQLQAIMEYERSIQKQHLKKQEEVLCGEKRRILVVDDEPDACLTYQIVLEDAGFECKSYTNSVKALQEFRARYYDLILVDVMMPILNGFELCKKIMEIDNTPHILFTTASEEFYEEFRDQHYTELINKSNTSYIQKPIGNKELVQIVNMIIAKRNAN
jgi:two-component system, OmpR family, alkaline phosphatase synthesis response regulator PhoP